MPVSAHFCWVLRSISRILAVAAFYLNLTQITACFIFGRTHSKLLLNKHNSQAESNLHGRWQDPQTIKHYRAINSIQASLPFLYSFHFASSFAMENMPLLIYCNSHLLRPSSTRSVAAIYKGQKFQHHLHGRSDVFIHQGFLSPPLPITSNPAGQMPEPPAGGENITAGVSAAMPRQEIWVSLLFSFQFNTGCPCVQPGAKQPAARQMDFGFDAAAIFLLKEERL